MLWNGSHGFCISSMLHSGTHAIKTLESMDLSTEKRENVELLRIWELIRIKGGLHFEDAISILFLNKWNLE